MGAINQELRILRVKVDRLTAEWFRVRARRHPTTAVERAEIARQAQELLRWVEVDVQALVDEGRGSDKDVLRELNTLYELRERLMRVINEVY
jgi:hypothetical protein